MLKPVQARQNPQHAAGFTLIEILVVLVIIGIIVTLAAVRFGGNDVDTLQREAERLSLLLETARDEAIASGASLGFSPAAHNYRFVKQDATAHWLALEDNEVLRPRPLPEVVSLENPRVNLQPLASDGYIVFAPSGVNAPFTLTLRAGDATRQLSADALGRVSLIVPGLPLASTAKADKP